jgi:hypothetical protein
MTERINAEKFFSKLETKQWLRELGTVPFVETLFVLRLKDLAAAISVLPVDRLLVIKPNRSRQSRGVALFKITSFGMIDCNGQIVTPSAFRYSLERTLQISEMGCRFLIEQAITKDEVHPDLQFACEDKEGPCVLRFVVHRKQIRGVAVLHSLRRSEGLAGAASRGCVRYSYLAPTGHGLTSEQILDLWDPDDVPRVHERIGQKTWSGVVRDCPAVNPITDDLACRIVPHVIAARDPGRILPWSIDGVLLSSGRFVIIELNHRSGHQLTGGAK